MITHYYNILYFSNQLKFQVWRLIDESEIIRIAELMKINLEDHADHITRVQKMLEYFDILDSANVESEEIIVQEIDLNKLRDDKYDPYNKNLLKFLKSYQGKYVKAPKLN